MIRESGGSDGCVALLSSQVAAFPGGERESNRPRRMEFNPGRCSEAGKADSARLGSAYVLRAVGKKLRERNSVAADERMPAETDPKLGTPRPRQRQSHVVDRAEDLVVLSHINCVGDQIAHRLSPDKPRF